ncbi:MAG: bile acid:sodium symporter family protein [Cyclobacteriaceae bacterium]
MQSNTKKPDPHGQSLIQKGRKQLARFGLDGFLIALISCILLAWTWPEPGIQEGIFSLHTIADYGVSVIFFFYGLRLSLDSLKIGLGNWRLHLTIQLTTFVFFPVFMLLFWKLFPAYSESVLWLGVFYLATLPSTVSSSVVMVSIAGGNIPGAIFNASISSLLGVFITPLWMGLFLTAQTGSYDLWPVIGKLTLQVLLPVSLGLALHSRFGDLALRFKGQLKTFDQSIILIIVYTSFCESFAREMFSGFGLPTIGLLGLSMASLFFLALAMIYLLSKKLNFGREDRITALFCGSKKSLVHGTVMSKVLFPNSDIVGIVLLPLMIYHALQLMIAGIIAQSEARKTAIEKDAHQFKLTNDME